MILSLKNSKAPGSDEISNEFYKDLTYDWIFFLYLFFNKIFETETPPDNWSKIYLKMLYKKRDREECLNYRGIALINCIAKIFTTIMNKRLESWAEKNKLLPESQSGFRRKRNCTDNIFSLIASVQLQLRLGKRKSYGIFVDYKGAFDLIPHNLLWIKLARIGVSSRMIRFLKNLYNKALIQVKLDKELTKGVRVIEGVLQGDSLSPLLFLLYISDIENFFRSRDLKGLNINGDTDILMLSYADDLIIFALSPVDIKKKLVTLEQYCNETNLSVNVKKNKNSKVLRRGSSQR